MTYRFPIRVHDRVALAPHLDLWMAGVRFGTVTDSRLDEGGTVRYLVECNERTKFWATTDDLLGAVGDPVNQEGKTSMNIDSADAVAVLLVDSNDGTLLVACANEHEAQQLGWAAQASDSISAYLVPSEVVGDSPALREKIRGAKYLSEVDPNG